ncbi:MAG: hypothetical protein MUC65_00810 [Pontiellaceae bacterium]|jgi:hypothetical protein|nr:hypothetical protein [Pontiellaceae bacterium]
MIPAPNSNSLQQAFFQVSPEASDYFRPWTYDIPLAIRPETQENLRRIQQLYLKCIRHIAEHYLDCYRDLMPVPDRVAEILALCRSRPYRPGTYRTDFVVGEDNRIRLIETTCRFAMNGYFTSGFFIHNLADRFLAGRPDIRKTDEYTAFYDRFMDYFGSFDHVCLLKGADNRNDTKRVVQMFEQAGFPVHVIPADEVSVRTHDFANAAVIGELSHEELCALPTETVEAIIASNLMNDLRTVFLIHDKRFFALLYCDEFVQAVLTSAEIADLRAYLVPTFTKRLNPEIWPQARNDKDRWIIKPYNMGKSIDVFAGPITPAAEWEALFDSGRADNMVLQEYIPQRKFRGTIAGVPREDYIVGTLLFFEDGFYSTGLFRASSHPVTNQGDDRKIAPLVTPDFERFEVDNVL